MLPLTQLIPPPTPLEGAKIQGGWLSSINSELRTSSWFGIPGAMSFILPIICSLQPISSPSFPIQNYQLMEMVITQKTLLFLVVKASHLLMMRQISFIFLVPMMDLTLGEMLFFCILFFFVNFNRDVSVRFKFEVIHQTSDTILCQILFFLVNRLWYFFFLLRRPNKRCTLIFNRSLGWFRY